MFERISGLSFGPLSCSSLLFSDPLHLSNISLKLLANTSLLPKCTVSLFTEKVSDTQTQCITCLYNPFFFFNQVPPRS